MFTRQETQLLVASSQINGVVQGFPVPEQEPVWQVSVAVQNKPSLQTVPFVTGVNVLQLPSGPKASHEAVLH